MSNTPPLLAAMLALTGISTALPALANEPGMLEEIIVTANFRNRTLMDSVGSISVLTQETITEQAALHLQDVLNAVPNVTWASGASRARFVQIRGVGDLEQYYDPKYYPAVGIMLDDLVAGLYALALVYVVRDFFEWK